MASLRCLKCGRFALKRAKFCSECGQPMTGEAAIPMQIEKAFSEETKRFVEEIDFLDATEIVSVIRRADDEMLVDYGDLDPDTTISLLVKGLFMSIVSDLGSTLGDYEDEDEDEEGGA